MKNKKKLFLVLIPVVLIAIMAIAYFTYKVTPRTGSKHITIDVVDNNGDKQEYGIDTDAEYLRQAMEEIKDLTFSGDESEYGMMVTTVNGVVADYNKDQAYWAFYVNDEYCNYGIDEQPVADGDVFRIEYTK